MKKTSTTIQRFFNFLSLIESANRFRFFMKLNETSLLIIQTFVQINLISSPTKMKINS